jgi:hypothetical protein
MDKKGQNNAKYELPYRHTLKRKSKENINTKFRGSVFSGGEVTEWTSKVLETFSINWVAVSKVWHVPLTVNE